MAVQQSDQNLHARSAGMFTDLSLATRPVAFQRFCVNRHLKSARYWGELASHAPANADLRSLAFKRMPKNAIEYFRGAAGENEISAARNERAFRDIFLNPHCARKFQNVDLSTTILGKRVSMPIIAAPVGSQRTLWPEGEAVAAEATGNAGLIYCLSTLTGTRMERVAEVSTGPRWFQLYQVGGREVAERGLKRAIDSGFEALVLTIDTAVAGNRIGDKRSGSASLIDEIVATTQGSSGFFSNLFHGNYNQRIRQSFTTNTWKHLGWLWGFLADGQLMDFPNIEPKPGQPMRYTPVGNQLKQSAITWTDMEWIRNVWGDKPIIIKGVHNIDDARLAEKHGAQAIVVSNHGGRQLDCTPSTLDMLREIAPQLKDENSKMEIYLDGGVRTGQDVVVARACGAKAVLIGRALAWGLAAGGPRGAARCFEIFKTEIEDTIRLLGKGNGSIDDIDEKIFYPFTKISAPAF